MYFVKPVKQTRRALREFINFSFDLYKSDPNWVPPLKGDLMKTLRGINNPLFANGRQAFFMAFDDQDEPVGRVVCGIDEKLNKIYHRAQGYFALFECINDFSAAKVLFDAVMQWQRQHGMTTVIGPVSPTNGDDSKGVLVDGFDGPPVLMNSYNPPYFEDLYVKYGFEKDEDHVAYIIYKDQLDVSRMLKIVELAQKRYDFHVDRLDLDQKDRECRDIYEVLLNGMPENWDYTTPPSLSSVTEEFDALKSMYDGHFCFIARTGKGTPIGFILALPDFNQTLKYLKRGRLFPTGFIRFYRHRSEIKGLRVFVQFVVKDYQRKGVNNAMFASIFQDFEKFGYEFVEGSTIGEKNLESRLSVEKVGMQLYRTYRVYRLSDF